MKLITIDRGNTNITLGLHENGNLKSVSPFTPDLLVPNTPTMISIVGKNDLNIPNQYPLKNFRTESMFIDMPVNYSMTLGEDRLSTAYYAFKKSNQKTIIIDAGTFLTVDIVNQNGFLGGYIFPGIRKTLGIYGQSAQLPRLKNDLFFLESEGLPQNTESAILAASKKIFQCSLENIIENESPDKIIITGGEAHLIRTTLNSSIPIDSIPHLVHSGLSLIHQNLVSLKLI